MKKTRWMGIYRFMSLCYRKHIPLVPNICQIFIRVVFGCVIPPSCTIGEECLFPHGGLGVVLHKNCVIGYGCKIQSHVVIGGRNGGSRVPRIGNHVLIGAGAIILGDVTVGDHAAVGAGAVVVHDVKPYTVVIGVPAREVRAIQPDENLF